MSGEGAIAGAVPFWTPYVLRDDDGAPLRVYHGTGAVFDHFDLAFSPTGFWFTDNPRLASQVATSPHARSVGGVYNVRLAFLRMRRPLRLRTVEAVRIGRKLLLQSQGIFDGIIWADEAQWVDPEVGPAKQFIVFSPEQVLPPFADLDLP